MTNDFQTPTPFAQPGAQALPQKPKPRVPLGTTPPQQATGAIAGAVSAYRPPTGGTTPPAAPAPAASTFQAPAGTQMQSFGKQSNLIGTQIAPVASPRLQGAQGMADNAAQTYNGMALQSSNARSYLDEAGGMRDSLSGLRGLAGGGGGGGGGGFGYGADTMGVRGQAKAELDKMLGMDPDRAKLAGDTYNLLAERTAPERDMQLRQVGQKAAALGRVGAGMTTNDLTGVQQGYDRMLDQSRRELSTDAAQRALDDRSKKLSAAQGLGDSFAGQDTAAGGLNLGYAQLGSQNAQNAFNNNFALDNAAFGRRMGLADAESAFTQGGFNNAESRFGNMADYASGIQGNERMDRNEIRGERDYQYGLSNDATNNRIGQHRQEENEYNTGIDQGMNLAQTGYGNSPAGAYDAQAQGQGQAAGNAFGSAADLLGTWGQRRAQNRPVMPRVPDFQAPNFDIPETRI